MARVSSNPAVVTKATRAPLRSSSALVATVVPWRTSMVSARDEAGRFADGFEDGAAGIVGRGGELEHLDAAADAVDAVSEGAAGIDGDGEVRGHCRKHIRRG